MIAMPRREYQQRERRYIVEYVNEEYPDRVTAMLNVAIGLPPEELFKAHPEIPLENFRRWRFYVDAVVVTKGEIIVIEGKIRKISEGLGQLMLYTALLPDTPELQPWINKPLIAELVCPRPDPRVIAFASSVGIRVVIWTKPWVQQYLREIGLA